MRAVLRAWFAELTPGYEDGEVEWRAKALADASHVVVAVDESGEVVGVAGLGRLCLDDELAAGMASPAEVFSVYVARPWLGVGVGRALLDQIEDFARSNGVTDIVAVSGPRHREIGYPFWNRRYGAVWRTDPDHWGKGFDRVVWRHTL